MKCPGCHRPSRSGRCEYRGCPDYGKVLPLTWDAYAVEHGHAPTQPAPPTAFAEVDPVARALAEVRAELAAVRQRLEIVEREQMLRRGMT